jgi:hypothetical protein
MVTIMKQKQETGYRERGIPSAASEVDHDELLRLGLPLPLGLDLHPAVRADVRAHFSVDH